MSSPNVRKCTLLPFVERNVEPGSTIHTDELRSYRGLDRAGYRHRTVNHSAGEYVSRGSHVNSIEGFWARLKLSIRGTHVWVSRKLEYRWNCRKEPETTFDDLVASP